MLKEEGFMENNYKETLNLPRTDMPMRAGLAAKEPIILNQWQEDNLYEKIIKKNEGKPKYILHDGPPYPNGNIHLGHALNKILKDIVVKYKTMKGYHSPYIPGWDCHGLPIETQLLKDLKKQGLEHKKSDIGWFRDKCKEYALGYVDIQRTQFKRLGIFGYWDTPYLTLNPEYEASIIEQFGELAENGYIYRGRKPIHWCMHCETALAEAEIEYADEKSPSVYVKFVVVSVPAGLKGLTTDGTSSILVWTTTPWTLPANVAAAVHPVHEYNIILNKETQEKYIVAVDLTVRVAEKIGMSSYEIIETVKGGQLEGIIYKHPFIDRTSPVVTAEYVSNEDGTGTVHIAPGHGYDDYLVGLQKKLPMIMPVDAQGKFTGEVPEFAGMRVWDANKPIVEKMEQNGTLLKLEMMKHSYPHCWRCKNPVIFRATEQWFVSMDQQFGKNAEKDKTIRFKALEEIKKTDWIPSWGEQRITSMIENRPDWCISRQRSWGIPLPVLYCECGEILMTGRFNKIIVDFVRKNGTGAWLTSSPADVVPKDLQCPKCGSSAFTKEKDIMDVWMESGGSHRAVLESSNYDLSWPADLYLEGSDQHRGWFHSSLLMSVGERDRAPYKAVLTHGFTVDEQGKKMSKSSGNVVDPIKVIDQSGADIIRLWVSSTDFRNDLSISPNILKQVQDSYMKIRNTQRFLLSNLYDFNPVTDTIDYKELDELDKWVLAKLAELIDRVESGYETFEFHQVYHSIYNFCVVTLSASYLDIKKDILYCGGKDSVIRRSAQTVMSHILKSLTSIVAPVLAYTSEEIWAYLPGNDGKSVHLQDFAVAADEWKNVELISRWEKLFELRGRVNAELEKARVAKEIGSSLESHIIINTPATLPYGKHLAQFFIVSSVLISSSINESIEVRHAQGEKCERCWKWDTLKEGLCPRCYSVVNG